MTLVLAHPAYSGAPAPGAPVPRAGTDLPPMRFADLVIAGPEEEVPPPAPALRLPRGPAPRLERAALGWDGSDAALRALRALPLVGLPERIEVILVDPPRDGPDRSDPGGMLALALAGRGHAVDVHVTSGDSAARLVEAARARRCGLLVLGGSGRGRAGRAATAAGLAVLCGG